LIVSPDVSNSTLPFIADGRTTNALLAGEEGEVLPNPDPNVLLAAAVTHYSDPTVSPAPAPYAGPYPAPNGAMVNVGGTLDLAGQVHYFPGGVSFSGSSAVVGAGTIVTGYGNPMTFQGSTTVDGNLIALASDPTVASNASITFQGSSDVKGLIYAHEDITFQGSFNLEGLVIAYRNGGGDLTTQGSTDITLDSTVLSDIPGFEAWANGFGGVGGIPGGSGPISARSWERQ
jgi:hypothetical protein